MSVKTKTKSTSLNLADRASQLGFLLMASATTFGMMDLPGSHIDRRVIVPGRPNFAFASVRNGEEDLGNNMRREEREEVAPHYIDYSVVRRTAPRSGKL